MRYNFQIMGGILLLAVQMLFVSCDTADPVPDDEPVNLSVVITQSDDEPGFVEIEAIAENTVQYSLFIDGSEQAEDSNATGLFGYTFSQPGYYTIEIRAYGSSGRYIKVTKDILIDLGTNVTVDDGYLSPLTYEGYDLVWHDEFSGTAIDQSNWVFETGTGCPSNCGWGNNELEYYRAENASVKDGVLVIEAREEKFDNSNYTSARMTTQNKQSFQYGRIDIRALLPQGQGIWPALWMLGNNISSVGWPACGEIDIMEMVGGTNSDNEVHGTLHWYTTDHAYTGDGYSLENGIFADEYHVFSIVWNESSIQWLVNDYTFHEIDISPSHMSEFHDKFFFIFNVAVGGNWPGSPNATTVFPQQMKVDYIRVFQ